MTQRSRVIQREGFSVASILNPINNGYLLLSCQPTPVLVDSSQAPKIGLFAQPDGSAIVTSHPIKLHHPHTLTTYDTSITNPKDLTTTYNINDVEARRSQQHQLYLQYSLEIRALDP